MKVCHWKELSTVRFSFNFTLDRLNNSFPLDNIAIEIRNDLICSKKGIVKYVIF